MLFGLKQGSKCRQCSSVVALGTRGVRAWRESLLIGCCNEKYASFPKKPQNNKTLKLH